MGSDASPSARDARQHADDLALYEFEGCIFCERVRLALEDLGVEVEHRDTMAHPEWRQELVKATGRGTVPVLRITEPDGSVRWLPESQDIIRYLYDRFGDGRGPGALSASSALRWLGLGMWVLLLGGALVPAMVRAGMWSAACLLGAVRSGWVARRTGAWIYRILTVAFAGAGIFVALEGLGVDAVPWRYAAYALVAVLLAAAVVTAWQRRRATG